VVPRSRSCLLIPEVVYSTCPRILIFAARWVHCRHGCAKCGNLKWSVASTGEVGACNGLLQQDPIYGWELLCNLTGTCWLLWRQKISINTSMDKNYTCTLTIPPWPDSLISRTWKGRLCAGFTVSKNTILHLNIAMGGSTQT
jgi:hypothetical protein